MTERSRPTAFSGSPAEEAPMVVRAASNAVYVAFIGLGFGFASWASRIPQVRTHLHLSAAQLGLVLLSIACGSVLSLPAAGPVVARIGSRRTVQAMAALLGAGLCLVAVGYLAGVPVLVAGLFVFGFATGAWDVAMNVQGARVEQRLGRAVMSRYHAGYSLGTVLGALLGVVMVAAAVPVIVHLIGAAAIATIVVVPRVRHFLPDSASDASGRTESGVFAGSAEQGQEQQARSRSALAAWSEPRTLLIGAVVLAFTVAEGAGNDWLSVAAITGYHLPAVLGTLAFAAFLAAMTAVRWFGTTLLDRYGRVRTVRVLAAVGAAGLLLFVFAPIPALAYLGAVFWGVGAALGFPVGMSAAADDPRYAAQRVSVAASIGYCAFLAGPPLIGLLGDHFSVLHALTAVTALLVLAALLAAALRAPTRAADRSQAR